MCYRCGDQYGYGRHNKICKSNGKTCFNCSQKNHFSSCCKNRKQTQNHAQSNFIVENSTSGSEFSEYENEHEISAIINSSFTYTS